MSLVIAPIMIASYMIGLPYGPRASRSPTRRSWFCGSFRLSRGPCMARRFPWGTSCWLQASRWHQASWQLGAPLVYGWLTVIFFPLPRLVLESTVLLITFLGLLVFVMQNCFTGSFFAD